jgi:hypothetical protein
MSNELIAGGQDGGAQLPAFMQDDRKMGVENLREFIIPPRMKVVQPLSGEPFSTLFNKGDVVLVPTMSRVAEVMLDANKKPTKSGGPFCFVPVFFFAEWCAWNPITLKGTLPAIRERSLDPKSDVARKSRNADTREERCPESKDPKDVVRYQEHLNFVVVLLGTGETSGIPLVMSFSRGEHRTGANLASLIAMRSAPIFGCIFEAHAQERSNQKGTWYGLDVTNPSIASGMSGVVTDEKQYAALKRLHLEMKDAHAKNLIIVDHDDNDIDANAESESGKGF